MTPKHIMKKAQSELQLAIRTKDIDKKITHLSQALTYLEDARLLLDKAQTAFGWCAQGISQYCWYYSCSFADQPWVHMTLEQKLRTVKSRVEFLLQRHPQTRNNDFYLTLLYLKYFDNLPLPYIEWDQIVKVTTPETISRCRRKIQNEENKLLPTDPKVRRQRKIAEEIYRQWAVQSQLKINWFGIGVLALWTLSILGIRLAMLHVLKDSWIGSLGSISIAFGVLYYLMTRTRLVRFREEIFSILTRWNRRKFIWVGIGSGIVLSVFMITVIYIGNTTYSEYVNIVISSQEFRSATDDLETNPEKVADGLSQTFTDPKTREAFTAFVLSPDFIPILSIMYASLDHAYDGWVTNTFSIILAEDIEVAVFLALFRLRPQLLGINPTLLK